MRRVVGAGRLWEVVVWPVGAAGGVTQLASKVVVACTPVGGRWGSRPAGRHCDGCWGGRLLWRVVCIYMPCETHTVMWFVWRSVVAHLCVVAGGVSQLTITG